ncbi:MAG TPA: tetratricopeptide repeat-containing protein [Verrucomicrobiota bacterium]|nr:tetratricopeptide repeat-containing protein [Verrucomicrobiota bacterium]
MKTTVFSPSALALALMAVPQFGQVADTNTWITVFDERFADNPQERFKLLPVPIPGTTSSGGTSSYDEEHKTHSVSGHLALVRPVRAGAQVRLDLRLRFDPPDTNAPVQMISAFRFVLFDRSAAGVEIERSQQANVPPRLRFVQETTGQPKPKVLREISLKDAALDGDWQFGYCHGLITLQHGGQLIGGADLGKLGVQVAGVTWIQNGGKVTCQRMTLTGEAIRETTPADQETLRQAASLNGEAQRLFRDGKRDEALTKMKEASALFVRVLGENHHDSANSLANLAAMLEPTDKAESLRLYQKALAIHEQTLGATHPHTTLTRFNLGKCYLEQGDQAKAKELWTRCHNDWQAVLGPDYSLVKSLDTLLRGM